MTNEYRLHLLADAQRHVEQFRKAFNEAKRYCDRMNAADDLELWTNRTAYLSVEGE